MNNNGEMYAALVGVFLPWLIAVIVQTAWDSRAKSLVAFAACVVAGIGTAFFSAQLTALDYVADVLIVLTLARTTYAALWHPTGVTDAIEAATSKKAPAAAVAK